MLHSDSPHLDSPHSDLTPSEQYGSGSGFLLNFYQNNISPVKGVNKCPMHPSCSQYSKIAFKTLPAYVAYVKTFDRIIRCGHELGSYPEININGFIRWYDPVSPEDESGLYADSIDEDKFLAKENKFSAEENKLSSGFGNIEFSGLDEKFASFLFNSGDYHRASTEYLRLRFYETDTVKKLFYLFKSGLCQYNSGDYKVFIDFAGKNRKEFLQSPELKAKTEYYLAKSYYELKIYNKAITSFDEAELNEFGELKDDIYYYRGISYARLFFWDEALKNMKQISKSSSAESLVARKFQKALPEAKNLPSLNPFFAGFASAVIPGSGYLYAHKTGTAISSFVINSLLAWTAYAAIKKENYSLAALTVFFGSGWYIGNIYGSSQAARDYNTSLRNQYVDKLLNEN
ncbi:MAG: membrane protein insertion efficiency factor YidD [Bacillota bacterium]